MEKSRGGRRPTDRMFPGESRKLILRAFENGASDREIAAITGMQKLAIQKIRQGKNKFVTRDTHDRIRRALDGNTDMRQYQLYSRVPVHYTRTMIYALCAQGWTMDKQREILRNNLGVSGGFVESALTGHYDNVYYVNEQYIRWLVASIGDARGPSTRTAIHAKRKGYFPTKHYDSYGKLRVSSLPKELRQEIEGV